MYHLIITLRDGTGISYTLGQRMVQSAIDRINQYGTRYIEMCTLINDYGILFQSRNLGSFLYRLENLERSIHNRNRLPGPARASVKGRAKRHMRD